ncbi:MAG: M15 family metallopeptidase [Bacteroidia bacterium]
MHRHNTLSQQQPLRNDEQEFENFLSGLLSGDTSQEQELAPLAKNERLPKNTFYPIINLGFKASKVCLDKEAKKCIRVLNRNTTALFYPSSFNPNQPVHLLFYFHGHLGSVPGSDTAASEYLNFTKNEYLKLREEIESSGKNVILIMPSLGSSSEPGTLADCGGFEEYFKNVKAEIETNILKNFSVTKMKKGKLILSGHSGGGKVMLELATFNKVDEIWGFDSIYQGGKEWPCIARRNKDLRLFFYYHKDGNRAKDGTATAILDAKSNMLRLKSGSLDNLQLIDVYNGPPKTNPGNPKLVLTKDKSPHFAMIRPGMKERLEALGGTADGKDWEAETILDELFNEFEEVEFEFFPNKVDSDFLVGDFDESKHEEFIQVEPMHLVDDKKKEPVFLLKEVYSSFVAMHNAAIKETCGEILLKLVSGTRNFNYQKDIIWEKKWNGLRKVNGKFLKKPDKKESIPDQIARAKKIMMESAMPGTSRHHWGTDFDLLSTSSAYFETIKGKKEYSWLNTNAHRFGFCQPYLSKKLAKRNGYEEEKWHWSYTKISAPLLQQYKKLVKEEKLKSLNFSGAHLVDQAALNVIGNYVSGVNLCCKNPEPLQCR